MKTAAPPSNGSRFVVHGLTSDRWDDLVDLFGPRGACGGCWCMLWRTSRKEFEAGKSGGNRRAFRKIVKAGAVPGLIGYVDGRPVAWIAVAPRSATPGIERSRLLKPIDDREVWSITCFFVRSGFRRTGLSTQLLNAAAEYVKRRGGGVLEGYPAKPSGPSTAAAFIWQGTPETFRRAGFGTVAQPSKVRSIVRREV